MLRKTILILLILTTLNTAFAQEERNEPEGYEAFPVRYELPGMDEVRVENNIAYGENETLLMDIYLPAEESEAYPLVIIGLEMIAPPAALTKDWGQFTSWGRILGASGFAAAIFHYSSPGETDPATALQDVETAVTYLNDHTADYQLDTEQVCYMGFSVSTPFNFTAAVQHQADCIVVYYGLMQYPDLADVSPLVHIENVNPADLPPLLLVNPLEDEHVTMPRWLREFVEVAREREINMIYVEHPTGEHLFDTFNDNEDTHKVIEQTLDFLSSYLLPDA